MTTIALSKARGTLRPVRRGEALEGLSDASQCEQQAVLEGVIHMQRQPYSKPEADHWADWPHFPPF